MAISISESESGSEVVLEFDDPRPASAPNRSTIPFNSGVNPGRLGTREGSSFFFFFSFLADFGPGRDADPLEDDEADDDEDDEDPKVTG